MKGEKQFPAPKVRSSKPTVPQVPHFCEDFGRTHDCIAHHGFVHPHRMVKVPRKF